MSAPAAVYLERPSARREADFLALQQVSRRLHRPWVAPPSTKEAYRAYLKGSRKRSNGSFFVVIRETREIAGVVNISEIVRGCFRSAYLGYYAFRPHAERGLMSAGLGLVLDHSFDVLGLHRLEANIQPENPASIRLVRRLGFRKEGFSPRYLKLGGRWRDHERWAILAEEWRKRSRSRA